MTKILISWTTAAGAVITMTTLVARAHADDVPAEARAWLQPQSWQRDTDSPVLSLGANGEFDDTHIFAPAVIRDDDGRYRMYYCGSHGEVSKRVFRLGLATSGDGRIFQRHADSPVFEFGDGRRSVLTPAFLRSRDGTVLRENGRLRIWFAATDCQDASGRHTPRNDQ